MQMEVLFKSVLEQDPSPVVLCDRDHTILYMNPVAIARYASYGGAKLLGRNLLDCHDPASREKLIGVLSWFEESTDHNRVHTFYNGKENRDVYMVALRDEGGRLIGYYEQHLYRDRDETPLYTME